MKKLFVLVAFLLATFVAQAKDHNVVVKGDFSQSGSHTEVSLGGNDADADTLSVVPAVDASAIYVLIRDVEGNIVEQYTISAKCKNLLTITSPSLPDGYILEIRDDKEVVYKTYENGK